MGYLLSLIASVVLLASCGQRSSASLNSCAGKSFQVDIPINELYEETEILNAAQPEPHRICRIDQPDLVHSRTAAGLAYRSRAGAPESKIDLHPGDCADIIATNARVFAAKNPVDVSKDVMVPICRQP